MGLYKIQAWLTDRVTISRRNQTQDNFGGFSETFEDILFSVPARLWIISGRKERNVAGEMYLPTMKMVVESMVDIRMADRVKVENDTYIVLSVYDRKSISKTEFLDVLLGRVDA